MAISTKGQTNKQRNDAKTKVAVPVQVPKYARDPGAHEVSQPVGNKIPAFLADSFKKPGWNR